MLIRLTVRRIFTWIMVGTVTLSGYGIVVGTLNSAHQSLYPDCRFGVGSSRGGHISTYDSSQLGIGWYVDWLTHTETPHPNGIRQLQTLRVGQAKDGLGNYLSMHFITPTLSMAAGGLGPRVIANPGAVWIIGNEPDREFVQDDMMPDEFAKTYKEAYDFIKGIDSTALVAMPGLVEVTPLRLKYLDAIVAEYQTQYGTAPPVDVWTVHIYILPEGASYGAHYPVGITPDGTTPAQNYTISQHDDMTIFEGQVRAMRQWMKDNGYRDTPLYFTEFGILHPESLIFDMGQSYTPQRVNTFMNNVFDLFRTATDVNTGLPADGNRLVQAWNWYSVADTSFNGALFDPGTKALTEIGQNYADYTAALGPDMIIQKTINPPGYSESGETVTGTLAAIVHNRGDIDFSGSYTATFYANAALTDTIGSVSQTDLGAKSTLSMPMQWTMRPPGFHTFYVELDTSGSAETTSCNNSQQGNFLVAEYQTFLSVIIKSN